MGKGGWSKVKGERPEVNIKKRMVKGGWGKVKGERSEVKDKQRK